MLALYFPFNNLLSKWEQHQPDEILFNVDLMHFYLTCKEVSHCYVPIMCQVGC